MIERTPEAVLRFWLGPLTAGVSAASEDAWRERMGDHYPAMALVAVTELVDDGALVEIEATAVVA